MRNESANQICMKTGLIYKDKISVFYCHFTWCNQNKIKCGLKRGSAFVIY